MFLRLLFVLLSALNIAVGAWLLLGQPYARGGNSSDPGVPELKLLSELPESATSAPVATRAAVVAEQAAGHTCLALGPFSTPQDLRDARHRLATEALRMRSRQEQTNQASGWWVYLPSVGNRTQALALARQLGAHNIGDYFVMSAGDNSSTISLGLFKDPANARKRRDDVVAAGFPARMTERTENAPQYWLDLVLPDDPRADWHSRIQAIGAGSHSTGCF
jgi:hypothetical protein